MDLTQAMDTPLSSCRTAVIGAGRLGFALGDALRGAGFVVDGPLPRCAAAAGADIVLLTVPDTEIAAAADCLRTEREGLVGHCSGATGLGVLAGHEAFSLHPLMTVTEDGASFGGAACAVAGATPRALAAANDLAAALGMTPTTIADEDRAAYHAAASIASNFLVTLEAAAEHMAATAGAPRAMLVPLVRATVENWAKVGPHHALTGPIARGDAITVTRQRDAVAQRAPELLALFDALADATRELSVRTHPLPANS
jgi:predicted short-subunit dehydrogenase-like oxidoreductase (DUF2520 family)